MVTDLAVIKCIYFGYGMIQSFTFFLGGKETLGPLISTIAGKHGHGKKISYARLNT